MLRKIFKILMIIIGSIAGLIVLLIIFIWLGLLNGLIARTIEEQAGKALNGELSIGSVEGNLLSDFSLHDITIIQDSDTILYAGEVRIDYNLIALTGKEIRLDIVSLKDITLNLVQDQDSVWNITRLVRTGGDTADTASGAFSWKVFVNGLSAERLAANIVSVDTTGMIPSYAETGFRLRASVVSDIITARVDSMRVIIRSPDFEVAGFTGGFSKTGDLVTWKDVILRLENSLLLSEGFYSPSQNGAIDAKVESMPLHFDDLRAILPDLKIYGTPEIKISLEGDESEYRFTGIIDEKPQRIDISGNLADLRNNPEYLVNIIAENLDGSHWTQDEKLKTNISGNIEINGKGFDIKTNKVNLNAELSVIEYDEYSLKGLIAHVEKTGDMVSGNLSSSTFAGDIKLQYNLSDVFGDPAYDIILRYSNVNIANIPGIDSLDSDLNGELRVNGKGISPETIIANVVLDSDSSMVAGEPLGNFTMKAAYTRGDYDFGLEGFGVPYLAVNAEGNGNIRISNNISFNIEPLDPARLARVFGMPYINASGTILGNISGNPDSLYAIAEIRLDSIVYDTIKVSEINSEAVVKYIDKALSGNLRLNTGNIGAGSFGLISAEITGDYSGDQIDADINLVVTDSLRAGFTGSVEGFDNPLIRIKRLAIGYGNSEWSSPHDTATILMNEDNITVNGFMLGSGGQAIGIDGRFSFEGPEDISVTVSNLELGSLPLRDFLPYEVSGLASSYFTLTGTAAEPVIDSRIMIDGIDVNGFVIDSIRSEIAFRDSLLRISGRILTGLYKSVEMMLDVPVRISFNDTIAVLKDDPGFKGSVRIDSLDLEEISGFLPFKEISAGGFANVNIEVGNTMSKPVISGSLGLNNGRFIHSQFGAEYEDIQMFASIDSSTVALDTLSLRTGKGRFAMNGYLSLENTDSLELNDFNMKLMAKDFQAARSGAIALNFDSDLDLSGTLAKPGFKGGLAVNSSRINIDYFAGYLSQKTDDPNPPLLIEALRDTVEIAEAADTAVNRSFFSGTTFYKNLTGEAVVEIPGNTWITGKDMNFELNGSVRAVKASEDISLFGDLSIRRGYYKIYGRNFDFEKGEITFTGSSDFNPDVDFEIVYRFRDIEKELKELRLLVTGKLMQPDLRFMLDEEPVEEKDAISYIIFGKSVNQLGEGERDKISGENLAVGAAVTQLSSVLRGVLQETAGVDVFDVSGGEDWKSGSVTIGKYITNNLFLSYDRSFDFDKQSKTADTEKIMLEYQLLRKLILKATNQEVNSGFDLIWRKTWR